MKVYELKEYLEECDPQAEVLLGIQPRYPFEHSVGRVITRRDVLKAAMYDDGEEEEQIISEDDLEHILDERVPEGGDLDDVFIVENQQERYGSKKMWSDY